MPVERAIVKNDSSILFLETSICFNILCLDPVKAEAKLREVEEAKEGRVRAVAPVSFGG